jgi:hypothetical protein
VIRNVTDKNYMIPHFYAPKKWSSRLGLNQRLPAYKADTLTAELREDKLYLHIFLSSLFFRSPLTVK